MTLAAGARLGWYEIVSALGAGGMGEVYRARDTKLDRLVAIKILPDSFAHDPDRLARFEREAKTLAALNHPNIGGIYGLEAANGITALVLELVEGPTLADVIAGQRPPEAESLRSRPRDSEAGPARGGGAPRGLELDEALPIARQIAEALEAAHEQGIIHRDLKPANIKVRSDGTVKVLDFGLAKALEPAGASSSVSQSPTITTPAMTQAGLILGTAAYMAPEQAKGRAADKRSDIWAFGCVLYEMLTGLRAFGGEDVSDTLAAVLRAEPDWGRLPAETPLPIRRLMRRSLEKDRRRRLSDAADARLEIEDALATPASEIATTSVPTSRRGWWRGAVLAAGAVVVGAAAAGGAVWIAMRPGPARVTRTTIQTSGDTAIAINSNNNVAITPDGSRVVYRGAGQLLMRHLDQLEPTRLTGLGSPAAPFIAPDGQWVGFFDGTSLKKVAISGGPPVTLAQNTITGSGGPFGATWSAQGTIVFATSTTRGLRRISAAGGEVETLTTPDRSRGEFRHGWPEFLPDGRNLLFTVDAGGILNIVLLDVATGTQTVLIRGGSRARYVPTGHLVYEIDDTLRAVAFDLERRSVVGTPVPVLAPDGGAYEFDVAADGTLVYLTGRASSVASTLVWVDRRGEEKPLGVPDGRHMHPRIAPDGARVVFFRSELRALFVWDIARARLTRAVLDEAGGQGGTVPLWTPDGGRFVFSAQLGDRPNLFIRPTDGTGKTMRLTDSAQAQHPTAITPDGEKVVFYESTVAQQRDIRLLTLSPTPRVTPLVETRFDEGGGVVSPDGRWLAYESNTTGPYEIYVRPFPAVDGGIWPVSAGGGMQPLWARDGRELFYIAPDGALMTVAVEARGSVWSAGAPVRLLAGNYYRGGDTVSTRQYDVTADGQRFLMIKEQARETETAPPIFVVQNWFAELKRLVPVN
jgi:serine/threonine protein kinase/Tol biopolymer transport system component